jgi:hypothetical protein
MEKEEWKKIDGFEHYEVSSHGRVRSKARSMMRSNPRWKHAQGQEITVGGRIIKGWIKKNVRPGLKKKPYAVLVSLRENGKTYTLRLHRLVLGAFVGPCPKGKEGCHNDGNPLNNNIKNLRWDTRKANAHDSVRHGTYSPPPVLFGESHPNATISDSDVAQIRKIKYQRGLYSSLARKYNVAPITIRRIYKGDSRRFAKNEHEQVDANA